ncbi:asparaginase [Austwickia sp. TVS 96-490-7B]|uniref:asparaginase n=1 Tax=Austwickia sp. TVS 96-490-7B TaxID=2830843 RepID=UPI001C55A320|nr:asparaginase [Austwickia sp. TVS 96-490-7B]
MTSPANRTPLPHVVVLGTGGTIAGSGAAAADTSYVAGVIDVGSLVRAIPGIDALARIDYRQICQIDSCDMDFARQLQIGDVVRGTLADPDVDAVVLTHGTDTMEETAYLLHLTISSDKPIVLVGAMRPADAISADGPGNLLAAVATAASPLSRGCGVLVVLDDQIHSARHLTKKHTTRVGAFGSTHGPIGEIVARRPRFHTQPLRRYGADSMFADAPITNLPPVEIIVGRAGMPPALLAAVIASGAAGLMYVGHGHGTVPVDVQDLLAQAATEGLAIVRTTRVAGGTVARNGAVPDDRLGLIAGDDLGAEKGRILLALALTHTRDPLQIQQIFDTH